MSGLKRWRWAKVTVGVALVGAGVFAWSTVRGSLQPGLDAKPATTAPAALRVKAVEIVPSPFRETISASGTLRAEESVELQAEVTGKVVQLPFDEGQPVRAGALLVKIDDTALQASLRRAQARRELAAFRERRLAQLVGEGGISQQTYDEARGELAVIEAEMDVIRAELTKTEIRAPFSGVVGLRFISVGAYVSPATRIATLQDTRQLKVDFSVPERYASRVQPGDPVRFTVAGSAGEFVGEVIAVEPRIDVSTRSILLRARCGNAEGTLRPGSFARVDYTIQQSEASILVPAIAILSGLEERSLFVVRDGQAERRQVVTGARTPTHVQITSGLAPGDIVITSGLQQLRRGAAVVVDLAR